VKRAIEPRKPWRLGGVVNAVLQRPSLANCKQLPMEKAIANKLIQVRAILLQPRAEQRAIVILKFIVEIGVD
jgi:hypothetical protein